MAAKSGSLTESDVKNFLGRKENQKAKKKQKVTYSLVLVMEFIVAENKNRQLEDLPRAVFT